MRTTFKLLGAASIIFSCLALRLLPREPSIIHLVIDSVEQDFEGPKVISYDDSSNSCYISLKSDTLDMSSFLLELKLKNKSVGNHLIGDSINDILLTQHQLINYNYSTIFFSAMSGNINISDFDTINNVISGSFSGTLTSSSNNLTLSINSSTFHVVSDL